MQREIAEAMMKEALALGLSMNALSQLSDQLAGEDRTFIRKMIGDMLAANAALVIEISREYPHLDPDRAP